GKAVLPKAVSLNPIDPALLQVDVVPLIPKLRKNRTAHIDYLKHTLEEAATLRELVESERLLTRKSGGESEEEEETSEEEEGSFDPIPRTPEDSEKESDDEEEQQSRLSEEARIQEEEDAKELYRDVNINQGRGLQERLRLLETSFSEYRKTNQFADAVSAIPGIVHQYMDQQMKEA
nr:hypothetical protein [Tanacetum cinerariifolium]